MRLFWRMQTFRWYAGRPIIRADGIGAAELLKAILPLFPLDTYEEDRFILMEVKPGDPEPAIWEEYAEILKGAGAGYGDKSFWSVLLTMSAQNRRTASSRRARRRRMGISF